jgi:hypothetical protein
MRVKAALVAVVLGLAAATPAAADVYDDNPAAAALGPGNVYVFARAADGTILERHGSAAAWSGWSPLPGMQATSGPGAVAYLGTIQLFARGGDTVVKQDSLQDGNWSGWIDLDGAITSAVGAVQRRDTSYLDIVARGTNNATDHRWYTPGLTTPWSGWEDFGGNYTSAPSLVSWESGALDIFVRGTDGSVQSRYYKPSSGWGAWYEIDGGGRMLGAPASVSQAAGQFDLFLRGTDSELYQRHFSGDTGWGAYTKVDATPIESSPAVVSDQLGRMYVFARVSGELKYKVWTALPTPAWTPWTSLGAVALPVVAPAPAPAPTPAPAAAPPAAITPVLAYFMHAGKRSTRFRSLTVKGVPKGATVKVTCPKGCSAKSWTKRNASGSVSLARFVKKPLKVGTVLTVFVSKPGAITGVKVLTVRRLHAPSVATRCLPAGAKRPLAC